ncbi:MAG: chorismate mutase [Desulforudis sp.]|jgi:chorismate mutase|nr:MAG: chorismate mutase [Desulforudis sp.]
MEEAWHLSPVRGIRGATTVSANAHQAIFEATTELLLSIVASNGLASSDVASVFLTMTPDLNAQFPALAAREIGWKDVPLLCAVEINVPDALPMCIRVLLHVNTDKTQREIRHVYLRGAHNLRPDLAD